MRSAVEKVWHGDLMIAGICKYVDFNTNSHICKIVLVKAPK